MTKDDLGGGRPLHLVLGGGGARGLAHLGVLEVLEEAGMRPDAILGVSAGAIVGAGYALEPDARALSRRILEYLRSSAFRRLNLRLDLNSKARRPEEGEPGFFERLARGLRRQLAMELLYRRGSLFGGEILRRLVHGLLPDRSFEDCRIPFVCTAVDLVEGEEVVLESGDLRPAVVASSSVPGFFPPVEWDGRWLVDAGPADNLPARIARERGAATVLAVSLSADVPRIEAFPTGIDVLFRSEEIGTKLVSRCARRDADLVVEPAVSERFWLDFEDLESLVDAGRQAMRSSIDDLRRLVEG